MRIVRILLLLLMIQCGALVTLSQEAASTPEAVATAPTPKVPSPFFYDRRGFAVYQIGPDFEKMIAAVKSDGSFNAIALAAGTLEGAYYLGISEAHPKKEPRKLEKLRSSPLHLTVDGETVIVKSDNYYRVRNKNDVRQEVIMYWISKELFDVLTSAKKIYAELGLTYNLLASAENIKAMRVLRDILIKEKDAEFYFDMPGSPLIGPLMGYYQWDGYYVKAISRRKDRDADADVDQ